MANHPHPGNIVILDKVGQNVVGLPCQTIIKFISRGFQFKCEKLKTLKKVECSSCFGAVDCGRIPSVLKDLGSMRLSVTAPTEVKVDFMDTVIV